MEGSSKQTDKDVFCRIRNYCWLPNFLLYVIAVFHSHFFFLTFFNID